MSVSKRFPYSTRHVIIERFTHTAQALCAGRLGQLMVENGIEDLYYPDTHSRDVRKAISRMNTPSRENLSFAVQGLTVPETATRMAGDSTPLAVGRQRSYIQLKLGAATVTHLVRTAIEHKAIPFNKVDFRDPPTPMALESLLAVGLASHGLKEHVSTRIMGENAAYYLEIAGESVVGSKAQERGLARMPRTVYTAFQEGWFQPEQGGVLRPDAVQLGVQQMLNPDRDFQPINLETVA